MLTSVINLQAMSLSSLSCYVISFIDESSDDDDLYTILAVKASLSKVKRLIQMSSRLLTFIAGENAIKSSLRMRTA